MNRILLVAIKFLLSLAILGYLFNKAWRDDQFHEFAATPKYWHWLALALAACLAAHMIAFFRWRIMVRALELPFSNMDAVRIGFIGLFFNLFAFGVIGGDTLRAYYVARQLKDRIPEAIASVIVDRTVGMLTMFSVASVAFAVTDLSAMGQSHPDKWKAIQFACYVAQFVTVVGAIGLIALLFTPQVTKAAWFQKLTQIPRVGSLIGRLASVITMYRSRPRAIAICFLLSLAVNICFAITIYSIAVGISAPHPTFANHFVIEPIAMVANAVPLPGGLGGMEFALDFLYQGFSSLSFPSEHGVIVAFGFRIALLLVSAIGAFYWFTNRKRVAQIVHQQQVEGHVPVEPEYKAS